MKRISIFLLVFLMVLFSVAQSKEYQGLLWKISGNGLQKPSFLYGTMHVSNKVAFHLSDSFYKAIESVDVVALEINPERWMETVVSSDYVADNIGNAFTSRRTNSYNGFYKGMFELSAPENNEIGSAMSSELGILNSLLYRTNNYSADFQEDTYLDLFIFQAGKKQGKTITGLENLEMSMRLNLLADKPEEDKAMRKKDRENTARKRFELEKILDGKLYGEVMENAYRQGDLDMLDSMGRLSGKNGKHHNLIIVYRNIGMANAMDSIMQKNTLFAGVGAAHLPNSYGVINLLRQKGYTVTAVKNDKSDFGKQTKERLNNTFVAQKFESQTSFDKSFEVYMPGCLYEFPEADNILTAAYPDMVNGATYVITRMLTFAPLHGVSKQQYLTKIDSLFFENIPGKIEKKKAIEIDGVQGFDILNKTKRGDYQRYRVMVRPTEILIFKATGKGNFVKREDVGMFFDKIRFYEKDDWHSYSPTNTAYRVSLPGTDVYEAENTSFLRGYWKKNVQSFHPKLGYYAVLSRSHSDLEYMEEDSFELRAFTNFFVKQFGYTAQNSTHTTQQNYAAYTAKSVHKSKPDLYTKAIAVGQQYYLMAAQTNDPAAVDSFMKSISFQEYSFKRPAVLRHDTARMFSVKTSVEVPAEERDYYNYYSSDNDEDNSHQEESKTAVYYNKESDETIRVHMHRYHKYFYEEEVDSLWARYTNRAKQGTFFVRSERAEQRDNIYTLELQMGDTNSSRNILVKHFLRGGMLYSLFTEIDYQLPRSAFVDTFFTTFTPWDTAIGTPILQNKVAMFLGDLVSLDSTTRDAANRSFDDMVFESDDAPQIIAAYYATMGIKDGLEIRRKLADKIGYYKHESIQPWVTKALKEVGDSVQFQIPLLEALAAQRTKSSSRLFAKVLVYDTPLGLSSRSLDVMFYPFEDSLNLCEEIFPDVLLLTSLREYREKIYKVLAMAIDSGAVKPRIYKKHIKQMAWEANNEVKRQQASEAILAPDFYKTETRNTLYEYEDILLYYTKLLLPYAKNSRIKRFLLRAEQLKSPRFKVDFTIAKVQAGVNQPKAIWEQLTENKNDRIVVYQRLKDIHRLDLFPKKYNHDSLAIALYAQKARVNQYRDSLVLVDKHWVSTFKDTGYLYFFKVKSEGDWSYGYLGPVDTTIAEVERDAYDFDDEMSYSKYENEALQIRKQVREFEMAHRMRYRVTDETEFETLKSNRRQHSSY